MNEIRFNNKKQEDDVVFVNTQNTNSVPAKQHNYTLIKKILSYIIIMCILAVSAFFVYKYFINKNHSNKSYVAVFLSNGQVYFGKVVSNDKNEIVLNNVYYLKDVESGSVEDPSGSITKQLSIIKLGTEIHGPTDSIFINKQNMLFFEELRDNSKVVETINNQKTN